VEKQAAVNHAGGILNLSKKRKRKTKKTLRRNQELKKEKTEKWHRLRR